MLAQHPHIAIGTEDAVFVGVRFAWRGFVRNLVHEAFEIVFVSAIEELIAARIEARLVLAEYPEGFVRLEARHGFLVEFPIADMSDALRFGQMRFACAQRRLRPHEVGDIDARADAAPSPAAAIA